MLLAIVVATLGGCSALKPGNKALQISITATRDCNSCGKPGGYPLTYRVLQVTDASVVTGMSLSQLWGKEEALLGPALLDKKESFIDPGATKVLPVERKPGATAFIIVGNFCKADGSCWYYPQPLAKSAKVKLTAGASCLTVSK